MLLPNMAKHLHIWLHSFFSQFLFYVGVFFFLFFLRCQLKWFGFAFIKRIHKQMCRETEKKTKIFLSANIAYNKMACIKMKFGRTNLFTCSLSFLLYIISCLCVSECVFFLLSLSLFSVFYNTKKNMSQYYHLIRLCSFIYSSYKWLTFYLSSSYACFSLLFTSVFFFFSILFVWLAFGFFFLPNNRSLLRWTATTKRTNKDE